MTMVINGRQMGRVGRPAIEGGNKTKKMLDVEERLGEQLEHALPELVTEHGLSATADYLNISKATLGYWLLKLGMKVKRVVLAPGDTLEVKRGGER